ncbi:putative metalloreductase AIM14 [Candida viswanathii]|uniref:Probable metalloreductase AIM14 n=1 Tax=Candida viswanathii TaxID=5486 RepID=A0A367YLE3_9ASCO|nr:putative metalloreductase AIM14 [Candida viswanathii]
MSNTSPQSIEPRHGGHHNANVKYGFIIFAISIVHILFFLQAKFIQVYRWKSRGRFSKTLSTFNSPPTWLVMVLWFLIVFFVGGHKITEFLEEYITIAKRYGRIAYCLLPLNIYLVLRPTNSAYLKPGYYLENLSLHKWISRLIAFCTLIHAIGFVYKWSKEGTLLEKPFRFLNFLGVLVFVMFAVLIVISVRFLRRKYYSVFYIIHNVTAWLMVVLIVFHARPGVTTFGVICLVLLGYQLYLRFYAAYRVNTFKVIDIPTSTLEIVKVPKPANFPPWLPGSHIRLNYGISNVRSWVGATHPFTIANIPEDGVNYLTLIVKKTNNFVIDQYLSYLLTGPYVSIVPPFFNTAKIINIICGGSGISFGLPVLNHYRSLNLHIPVRLVWCVRNQSDTFIMNQIDMTGVQVYITSAGEDASADEPLSSSSYQPVPLFVIDEEQQEQPAKAPEDDQDEVNGLLDEEGIPLQNIKKETDNEKEQPKNVFKYGRPKFDEVFAFDDPTLTPDYNDSWVIACGPDQLIKDAKRWSKEKDYRFYSEKYEM